MSVARFIADQRTNYRVPHTVTCLLLGVSLAWFYKWLGRATGPSATSGLHTTRDRRRDTIDRAVKVCSPRRAACMARPVCMPIYATTAGRSARRRSRTRCAARGSWHAGSSAGTGSRGRTRRPRSSQTSSRGTSPPTGATPSG